MRVLGHTPTRPKAGNPLWDLLWETESCVWVAEVKSITDKNEERQLRLGLGQLLRYRHRLITSAVAARAVLMIERARMDSEWNTLCADLDVVLVWPAVLDERVT